jgi:phosphoribosylamine---glycine ligase
MKVLVVGGGGREHALTWGLARNPTIDGLFVAPGNAGMSSDAVRLPVATDDLDGLVGLVEREAIDLTVIGPEVPLVAGLADRLEAEGRAVFGPSAVGARLEASKAWAKELCFRYGVPTARSLTVRDVAAGREALDAFDPPYVVKADGLAAGKGVVIAETRADADVALRACLDEHEFGEAGDVVVIEEFLMGPEVSAFALTDGRDVLRLAMAQDFKRAEDGDVGPNTGGMGAYSPVGFVDGSTERRVADEIFARIVEALRTEGVRYRGVLYAGLVLTAEGPKLLEFNCRFGDPETQAIVPRLDSDLAELLLACTEGNLGAYRAHWRREACVTVVVVSAGYPGRYETGFAIDGLREAALVEGALVFHAGTEEREGRVVTAGGRVLAVSALGADASEARDRAYEACSRIRFEGMRYRRDIARRAAEEAT